MFVLLVRLGWLKLLGELFERVGVLELLGLVDRAGADLLNEPPPVRPALLLAIASCCHAVFPIGFKGRPLAIRKANSIVDIKRNFVFGIVSR